MKAEKYDKQVCDECNKPSTGRYVSKGVEWECCAEHTVGRQVVRYEKTE